MPIIFYLSDQTANSFPIRLFKMELPASGKGKNGFDNPRSTRIKMRQACLKRLAVEYNQARATAVRLAQSAAKNPPFNPAPEKAV